MNIMLYIGLGMAVVAFLFWAIELAPFIKHIKSLKFRQGTTVPEKISNTVSYNLKLVSGTSKLIPFIIDILITTMLTSIFSFGGMVGGIIGLLISNLFSLLIISVSLIGGE